MWVLARNFSVYVCVCFMLLGCKNTDEPTYQSDDTVAEHASEESLVEPENNLLILSERIQKEEIPSWVVLENIPEFPKEKLNSVQNGIAYLLSVDKVQVNERGHDLFSRLVYKVVDREGLETAAQISHSFDPEHAKLSYNLIKVVRGKDIQNRLVDVEIQELRREGNLSEGLIDGRLSSLVNLEDIRVGDIVDIAYTLKQETPLWSGHYFDNVSTNFDVPLALQIYEVAVPSKTTLVYETLNADLRPKITHANDLTVYSFTNKDPNIEDGVANIPIGIVTSSSVSLSTMQTLDEVVDWGLDVYNVDMSLPEDYRKKIKGIARNNKSLEAKMVAALRLVQDEIRYLGIENGVNAYQPRTPMETLTRGYGDCKDKTILLISALQELGVSSVPTLVSTTAGDILPQYLPAVSNFNHVIVRAEIDGTVYWLDPTLTFQGGDASNLVKPDYGYVLPFKADQSEYEKIELFMPDFPTSTIVETYRISENEMEFRVVSEYRYATADFMRQKLATTGLKGLSKSYLEYYEKLYSGLQGKSDIKVNDDFDNNVIIISENYFLDQENFDKNSVMDKFYVYASTLDSQLPTNIENERNIPLGLTNNTNLEHKIVVEIPNKRFVAPEDVVHLAEGVNFERKFASINDRLEIDFSLKITKPSVGLVDAVELVEKTDKISDALKLYIYPKQANDNFKTRFDLKEEPDAVIEEQINDIIRLIRKKSNVEALEKLNNLEKTYTTEDGLRGYIQTLRATLLVKLDRKKAAAPAFKDAFSLYNPDYADPYFKYASILRGDDDDVASAQILKRMFEELPDSSLRVKYDWLWRLLGELYRSEEFETRDDLILALAKAQLANKDEMKEADLVMDTAVPILVEKGQIETATAYLEFLRHPTLIRSILIDKKMEPIWEKIEVNSGKDLAKSMEDFIAFSKEQAEAQDADFDDKTRYLTALSMAGAYEAGIDFGKPIIDNWSKIDAEGTDAFWFVNRYAHLLSASGQSQEADDIFKRLIEGRLTSDPELVSMAINRLSLLTVGGSFKKAVNLAEAYEKSEAFRASDFGWMFVHQAKACARAELGELEDAKKEYRAAVKDIYEDNLSSHFVALVCLEEDSEAAGILIDRLVSKKTRDGALPVFSTWRAAESSSEFEKRLRKNISEIASREDVQSEFQKYGRSIHIDGPSEYWAEW